MYRKAVLVLLSGALLLGSHLATGFEAGRGGLAAAPQAARQTSGEVVARGRIEPQGGVVAVSGPPESLSTVAIVDKLMVGQGSQVEAGQLLAILSGYDLSRADLDVSLANLALARLQRTQLQAGVGKAAEIAAQANVLAARRVQLVRVERDWNRTAMLAQKNAASTQALDAQKAAFDQVVQEVEQAENTIKALTEVRPIDDEVAAGQVAVAEANVARARAATERLQIRARAPGTVLSIQTRAGEVVSGDGILRLGDLDRLIAIAEIDETQVGRVKLGMAASIEGAILAEPIEATVSRIAAETHRQKRPSSDILVGRDARIVEVEVTPAKPLPKVVGAEVTVRLTASPRT